jgi:hypothetical protein
MPFKENTMLRHTTQTLRTLLSRVATALVLAATAGMAGATTLHVQIDPTGFRATSGYLDMQLSATSGVPLATTLLSNLSGFDPAAYVDQWGLAATSGGYLFRNDTANDFFQAVSFSGPLSFDLTFDGAADPLTLYVSRFVVSAFDENFGLLGTHDPDTGALATFSWTPALMDGVDGMVSVALADPRAVKATVLANAVPEPGTWLLLGAGCAAALVARRRSAAPGATTSQFTNP